MMLWALKLGFGSFEAPMVYGQLGSPQLDKRWFYMQYLFVAFDSSPAVRRELCFNHTCQGSDRRLMGC